MRPASFIEYIHPESERQNRDRAGTRNALRNTYHENFAGSHPIESENIVATWRRVMGMELNIHSIEAHLETLKRWHGRLRHKPT